MYNYIENNKIVQNVTTIQGQWLSRMSQSFDVVTVQRQKKKKKEKRMKKK